jgi:hypothetical protein
MGFVDKLTGALSGGSSGDGGADDIVDEFEEEEGMIDGEGLLDEDADEEEEEVQEVWDSAYRFFEDFVEDDGHMDGMDFAKSAAFYEIKTSNLFRDRIQSGKNTIEMVATAKETIESVKGAGEQKDYGQQAERLKEANELIDQVDKVSGKEDEMIQEALSIGKDLAGNLTETVGNNSREVESEVRAHDEEL